MCSLPSKFDTPKSQVVCSLASLLFYLLSTIFAPWLLQSTTYSCIFYGNVPEHQLENKERSDFSSKAVSFAALMGEETTTRTFMPQRLVECGQCLLDEYFGKKILYRK